MTFDVARAVKEVKAGKIEFRVDKGGNVHAAIGKVSFAPEALADELHGVHGSDRSLEAGCGEGRVRPQRRDLQHDGPGRQHRHHPVPLGDRHHEENREGAARHRADATSSRARRSLYYTDFTGLNVKRMTELRRRLERAGVDYVVIKNTLALRAVNESGLVGASCKGPTGLVVGKDPVAAAKVLTDFAKENEQKPAVKGGMLEGKAIRQAQVKQLASLPSREQMLADLGAGMQSPMAAFVGALNGLLYMFAGALDALKTQREGA